MTEKIIRTPDQIAGATLECLLLSYNALTGRPIKRFADRATAERRLEMAMLAAQDATAHAGVPKGTTVIIPRTAEELGHPLYSEELPEDTPAQPDPRVCVCDFGKMVEVLCNGSCELGDKVATQNRKPRATNGRFALVRAKAGGTSKLQPNSVRNAVMQAILVHGEGGVPLAELDLKFPPTARGHIQKLLASGHVECFNE
jgi:hypothetical protein